MSSYSAAFNGSDCKITISKDGVECGGSCINFADIFKISAISHRVILHTLSGEQEISMLGFSFDGFWEQLNRTFAERSLEALFIAEPAQMMCEGEYSYLGETGRGTIALYSDAVCIIPVSNHARRIPLCFANSVKEDGYLMTITVSTGESYTFGRMGYDTKPFFERTLNNRNRVVAKRAAQLGSLTPETPFSKCGLFRTGADDYFLAAFGKGKCAVELKTEEDTATYLYEFKCSMDEFFEKLCYAMEAVGTNREVIYISDDKLKEHPIYRMSIDRTPAVGFLRNASAGRLIHSSNWEKNLEIFLGK